MSRMVLDQELRELDAQILRLGELSETALARALEALESNNRDESGDVIVSDTIIDRLDETIEEHLFRVLTLQQPLGGRDLRYLTSLQPITIDLERIGDEAESLAEQVLRMVPLRSSRPAEQAQSAYHLTDSSGEDHLFTEDSIMRDILDLGQKVRQLLQETMRAFAQRDAQAARTLWKEDSLIDRNSYLIRRDVMAMLEAAHALPALQQDPHVLQRATHLLWITHEIERAADHCTNICERIAFLVEGETDLHTSEARAALEL